ncbi:hypothetical protein TELCIR_06917 [Teladorsagia circumcincta]|uniref:Peptidase M12A domain-containing protein n=1 Tax=Teladorsagia circumcincta TaxID=45464 RepID=A0A2G9ULV0_TELCI|nr:hypothetical protein TELCIR_06917 [Teladorsagia circumcincta]
MTFIDSVSINITQPAIMTFDLDYQETLGSPFVSFIDLSMVNELYGCKRTLELKSSVQLGEPRLRRSFYQLAVKDCARGGLCNLGTPVACEVGGFPNPRNCSKCVCPGGYGGTRCTERPKGDCGRTLYASPKWNSLTDVLGNFYLLPAEDFKSPLGTEIEIIFVSFSNNFAYEGCRFAGVEIKTNKDQRLTGYSCSLYANAIGVCDNSSTSVQMRTYCPKTCHLCFATNYANTATRGRHSHINS